MVKYSHVFLLILLRLYLFSPDILKTLTSSLAQNPGKIHFVKINIHSASAQESLDKKRERGRERERALLSRAFCPLVMVAEQKHSPSTYLCNRKLLASSSRVLCSAPLST